MTDYISKAQVLDIYAELYDIFEDNRAICKELDGIYDKINGLVNIEAKPVVRCKDCVFWNTDWLPTEERGGYMCDLLETCREANDFCDRGQWREE